MNAKTMEGLVGARTSMNLLRAPFQVFETAQRKGDTGTIERAMGYADDCSDKAGEYMAKAEAGMKEEAKEAKAKAELERESAIQKRREERKELEARVKEGASVHVDTIEISDSSEAAGKGDLDLDRPGPDEVIPTTGRAEDIIKAEPVIYAKTGEVSQSPAEASPSISVSV
ncbi:MAG: hypothetical protein HFE75_13180 [Firmicutes bacterium]|jgi:hypothetical protein|nr:hypothetical protein [Bacillota bacterium]NBI61548.1 hypothetical protein [Clostridiales bacterium]